MGKSGFKLSAPPPPPLEMALVLNASLPTYKLVLSTPHPTQLSQSDLCVCGGGGTQPQDWIRRGGGTQPLVGSTKIDFFGSVVGNAQ